MRKFVYIEFLIHWLKYFKTLKFNTIITNFVFPFLVSLIIFYTQKDRVISSDVYSTFYLGLLTVSTLIIGFSYSMIVSLITSNGSSAERVRNTTLINSNITLYEAMLYKFYFIIINLIILISCILVLLVINSTTFIYLNITLFIIISSLLILVESLTNIVSIFKK